MGFADPAAVGAFLSGAGAAISAVISFRLARKRAAEDCQKRIEEVKQAMHEGFEMGHEDDE